MRRLLTMALAALAAAMAGARTALAQADTARRIEQVMTPQEEAATGVAGLTPEQRAALEQWLARYATQLAQRQPAVPAAVTVHVVTRDPSVRSFRITSVLDDGGAILLDDGTSWEVYLPDRPATVEWRADEPVVVRQRGAAVGDYDYVLVNAASGTIATARLGRRGRIDVGAPAGEPTPKR